MLAAAAIGVLAGMVVVADNALHVPNRIAPSSSVATALGRETGSSWDSAQVTAQDGVKLDAWIFTPHSPNGGAVILLHGVADSRLGMTAHAAFLLRSGFTVLLPDVRGHGTSGGRITTYGVKEAEDVHRWAGWLLQTRGVQRLYGLGQSMGAAILLESLRTEPRFRAIVADCPFATFEEVAYDRLHQISRLPEPVFWPVIRVGFLYADLRYGVNLERASPLMAIRSSRTPVLLIHGTRDANIPPRHSQELAAANPQSTQLWLVENAGHVESLSVAGKAYERRVVDWLESHR